MDKGYFDFADEAARNRAVLAGLSALPVCELIRTATAAMRIHPDLAAPFAAAVMLALGPKVAS